MVRNAQAACLLLLLLASLASTAILSNQANQQTELQSMGTSVTSQKDFKSLFQKRWKRDSHFPICIFCCNCCHKACGLCCKT